MLDRVIHYELKRGQKLSFGKTMHCLPQRLKSTFLGEILSEGCTKETRSEENFSKNIDVSLSGNRATAQSVFRWLHNYLND